MIREVCSKLADHFGWYASINCFGANVGGNYGTSRYNRLLFDGHASQYPRSASNPHIAQDAYGLHVDPVELDGRALVRPSVVSAYQAAAVSDCYTVPDMHASRG